MEPEFYPNLTMIVFWVVIILLVGLVLG